MALVLLCAVAGFADGRVAHVAELEASALDANPLSGWKLFRFPNTPAAAAAAQFRAHGMTHNAKLMELISSQPTAAWLTHDTSRALSQVTATTKLASGEGAAAVFVAYDIPDRNCGEGAGASQTKYLRWIGEIAKGIGPRDTIVILEPDAVSFAVAGCPISLKLLGSAVQKLVQASGARVYIDAGNPSWITPASRLATPLREADIAQAAGFSLNISNFQTTAANIAYGDELSSLLGGAHFVIDTGRNGNGPDTNPADAPLWCDPPGRALGSDPTTNTGVSDVDAYLWVKPPGASDGGCRPGAPTGGEWWTKYALELAADTR